jgi:hypothetical protein
LRRQKNNQSRCAARRKSANRNLSGPKVARLQQEREKFSYPRSTARQLSPKGNPSFQFKSAGWILIKFEKFFPSSKRWTKYANRQCRCIKISTRNEAVLLEEQE